jgi:ABC-type dipeptide/oligopeptide/nickel transport system permease component
MSPLAKYTVKRLLFVPVGAFIIISFSFLIVNAVPSNPAREKLGEQAPPAAIDELNRQLGLDQSLWQRYLDYLSGILHFDLGTSYYTDRPVIDDIVDYLPNTLELIVLAIIVATILGVGAGLIAAQFRQRAPDFLARAFIMFGQAIPEFFLGLLLIFFLFYKFGWVTEPTGRLGILDITPPVRTHFLFIDCALAGDWTTLRSALAHSVLPVMTLGIAIAAILAKTTRSVVARSLDSYQVEFARALGLPERKVFGYALRTARTPILTYGVIIFAALLGGAAIVEQVFAWNGLGQWLLDRMSHLDLPAMQGAILVLGLGTLFVLVVLDVLVAFLDPRVSL